MFNDLFQKKKLVVIIYRDMLKKHRHTDLTI